MKSDIEIARATPLQPIEAVAAKLDLPGGALYHFGPHKAKVALDAADGAGRERDGRLILVTAITPTMAGEGKTTTTVGLGDALTRAGHRAAICLREPSLGPCFGIKGGGAGGGFAQVAPMEDINLHFTGDLHAVAAANNLLAALLDNHVYWGNELGIDERRISWRRAVDMNDRALRSIVNSLGGVRNGFPREDGFDITAASEVMAILCLATDLDDLTRRLAKIIVGHTRDGRPVTAADLNAEGPMSVLLKDAMLPNLVQSLEGTPAFVHGGPFANIAHGCNSVIATRMALSLADYVVTEAGFGADLGAEKFFDIKCRKAGLRPAATALVVSIRALKSHGGVARGDLTAPDPAAIRGGAANLARHVENLRQFGVPSVVAINRFPGDTDAEVDLVRQICAELDTEVAVCTHWMDGGAGAQALAEAMVAAAADGGTSFRMLYDDDLPLWDKIRKVAQAIYGARGIIADTKVRKQIAEYQAGGFGTYPVCIAKTQLSFSTDAKLRGAPSDHVVPIREVRLANGAEFLVAICGDVMTMPGLPRRPAAMDIELDAAGEVVGLF